MSNSAVLIWSTDAFSLDIQTAVPEVFHPAAAIAKVSCGGNVISLVTQEGRVYAMDMSGTHTRSPRLVEALRRQQVAAVSCGSGLFLVLNHSGAALAVRLPIDQQSPDLAVFPLDMEFMALELPHKVLKVSCGETHALLATNSGSLFAFGRGTEGQLGLGDTLTALTPACIDALGHLRTVDIAAGRHHSLAASTLGNVFSWGGEQRCSASVRCMAAPLRWPSLVPNLTSITAVAACTASAAIRADGVALLWGIGDHLYDAAQVFEEFVVQICLSRTVICGITGTGRLLLRSLPICPASGVVIAHNNVSSVSVGSHHVIALKGGAQTSPWSPAPSPLVVSLEVLKALKGNLDTRECTPEVAHLSKVVSTLQAHLSDVGARHSEERLQLQEAVASTVAESEAAQLSFSRDQARHRDAADQLRVEQLQSEVQQVRTELQKTRKRQERLEAAALLQSVSDKPPASRAGKGHGKQARRDSLLQDMESKHSQLVENSAALVSQRESLQAGTLQLRRRLTESSSRLEEAESSCLKMSASMEACRARNKPLQQQVLQLKQELASLGVHPEAGQSKVDLNTHGAVAELLSCLDLRTRTEDQLSKSRSTGASLELRTHERRAANHDLKRQLAALQSARARVADRTQSLAADRQAFQRGPVAAHEACLWTIKSLRQSLAISEASEARLRASIDSRAASFAKETEPLYSKVQQLHDAIALQHSHQENNRSASVLE